MIMKKILFIVGSLRRHSFNAQLAGYVEDKIKDKLKYHICSIEIFLI